MKLLALRTHGLLLFLESQPRHNLHQEKLQIAVNFLINTVTQLCHRHYMPWKMSQVNVTSYRNTVAQLSQWYYMRRECKTFYKLIWYCIFTHTVCVCMKFYITIFFDV